MTATNPFTEIKTALQGYLVAHWNVLPPDNPAIVKAGNRWEKNDRKGIRQAADLPSIEIRPVEGGENVPLHTSTTGLFVRSYELGIATDETFTDPILDQCEWELIRVAAKAQSERLGLTDLVLKVAITSSRQSNRDVEAAKGKRTWTGAIVLTIQFQVPRSDIIPA